MEGSDSVVCYSVRSAVYEKANKKKNFLYACYEGVRGFEEGETEVPFHILIEQEAR